MPKTWNIEINAAFDQTYKYLQNPMNLADWVTFFEEIAQDEEGLHAQTPLGPCELAFVAPNDYGVLDHVLRDSSGREYYNPMRAIRFGEKTLLIVTLLDERDSEAVQRDLEVLKRILERQ